MQIKIIKKKFNNFHDKIMVRKKNTLTGIHGDKKTWKVLTCLEGKILVVLVNCDKKSKNFGKHYKIELRGNDFKSIVISPKIGNSYLCLSSKNIIYYKLTNYYKPKYEDGINVMDKHFKIKWPSKNVLLSKKDKKLNSFEDFCKNYKGL